MEHGSFNLSALALRHRTLVLFFIILFGAAGLMSYLKLGRAEDPDFTIKTMVVTAQWPGATTEEMEQQVTDKLEKKLQEVPYYAYTVSYTRPGETLLKVNLRDDAPPAAVPDAWYQLRKKIGDMRHTLPQGVTSLGFNDEFSDTFGTVYALAGDGFSPADLKRAAEDIRQRLRRLKDVAKIDLVGVQDEKLFVEISHVRLATLGIAPGQIFEAIQKHAAVVPAGVVTTPNERIALRISTNVDTLEQLRAIPIVAGGRNLTLGDVAELRRGYEDPPSYWMRFNGRDVIGVAVSMVRTGNNLELGQALDAELVKIRRELPVGLELQQVADQPKVVEKSVAEFFTSLAEALLIVLAVSFLSLGWRTGIVVALSVPLVLAITFLVMDLTGIYLHRISLGALIIALGLLVDDAIIAVEMMVVKMEEGMDRLSAAAFAYRSTAFPMLTGTLVTAAGFIPVGFARSTVSQYTGAMFWVVGYALLISWLVAVVFTPYLGFKLLPSHPAHHEAHNSRWHRAMRVAVRWCVFHRWIVIGVTVLAFVAGLVGFSKVPQQFFPASARPELMVDLMLPENASIHASAQVVEALEKKILAEDGVVSLASYIGGGTPRYYLPLNPELRRPNYAQFVLVTRDTPARERLLLALRTLIDTSFPEVRARVSRLENGPPVGYPVQFRVVGGDPQTLRRIAEEVRTVMRGNPHTRDVHFEWNELAKSVQLDIDHAKARQLGVDPQDLAQSLNALLAGASIAQLRDRAELVEVIVRARPVERLNLAELGSINIRTGTGGVVPLEQLATLSYRLEEPILWRRDRDLQLSVRADIYTPGIQAPDVTKEIAARLGPVIAGLPDGYRIETGGAAEESAKGNAAIGKMMPVMALVMITLLMLQLQSFSKVALVLLTAPLGVMGVAAALLISGLPFGFVALLGTIALAGMIMRNSVILVDQIDQDMAAGSDIWDAIIDSSVRRARPILLTAAAAIFAMIPLAFNVFWGPMAVAIMGGLTVATALTLLFLPALYAAWYRVKRPRTAPTADEAMPPLHPALAEPAPGE